MLIAETVQLDGGTVALILAVLLLLLLACVGVVVAGCIFARRAGRGSRNAMFGWAVIGTVELLIALDAVAAGLFKAALIPAGALAMQAAFWAEARPRQ
jgi:ABC-type uncharacterized transport system permease subunit